jgi:hypothetical protein
MAAFLRFCWGKVGQEWPPDQENDYVKAATSLKWVIDFQMIVL